MSGDSNFLETYQQRITEIQDVSDVIAVANLQLSKLLQKFGWSRQSFQETSVLAKCPINNEHEVKHSNLEEHVRICALRKNGIKSVTTKDLIPLSSSFCYDKTNIVSVNLDQNTYSKLGIKIPERYNLKDSQAKDGNGEINTQQQLKIQEQLSIESLVEDSDEIIQYQPCDPLDELRFIYSWSKIPPKYFHTGIGNISYETMNNWLHENIPNASETGNENKHSVVNFVMNQLKEMNHPDFMVSRLSPILKTKTRQFVLKIWKFACAKNLCFNSHIPEHTRNEFDFYGTTLLSSKFDTTEGSKEKELNEFSLLTNDWSFFSLTRDERLKIYEEVRNIGKVVCQEEVVKFEELKAQAEQQVKVIADFEFKDKGEKTHLEVMAELRDYKRRRLSYRGKNKDSRKLSAIEILRELVEQQMMYLKILHQQQHLDSKNPKQTDHNEQTSETKILPKNNIGKERKHHRDTSRDRHVRSRSRSRDRHRPRERSRSRDSRRRKSRSKSRERHRRHRSRDRRRSGHGKRMDDREREHSNRHKERVNGSNEISNITYYTNNA